MTGGIVSIYISNYIAIMAIKRVRVRVRVGWYAGLFC